MSDNALIRALRSFGQGASNAVASNVSTPVDGIAWLLRKGGLPIPQNPVGGSDWMAQQGLTATPQNKLAGLLGETAGMVGPAVVQAAAPKIAGGLLALDDKAMDMARQGIERRMVNSGMIQPATVWHGSPHKFDKFDSSKIGTGEGAQAYGHGLYLAESPDVAKQYADNVKDMGAMNRINAELSDLAKKMSADEVPGAYRKYRTDAGRQAAQRYDELMAARDGVRTAPGTMYKVDLPDNAIARMLDWDKPLSQQPEAFKAAVSAREQKRMLPILEQRKAALAGLPPDAPNAAILKKQIAILEDEIKQAQPVPSMTGGEYFNYLRRREMQPAEQAEWLRQAGIPGIRYLDGGSRGAGQGTSNYVIFPQNEGLLTILERNGVPIK